MLIFVSDKEYSSHVSNLFCTQHNIDLLLIYNCQMILPIWIYMVFQKFWYDFILKWPPCSPDLTPCNFFFFLLRLHEVTGLCLFSSKKLREKLKQRITATQETIIQDMQRHVWQELDNHLDMCCVTGSAPFWKLVKTCENCSCFIPQNFSFNFWGGVLVVSWLKRLTAES